MPERVQKLKAHTEWLLDLFLELKENYAFLEPMLFDRDVVSTYGSSHKARVFNAIKFAFFYTCAQDLAKLAFDSDPRTPSIKKVVQALSDTSLREIFRREYSIWKLDIDPNEPPEVQEALRNMEQEKAGQRCTQFDSAYTDLVTSWAALKSSSALAAFKAIRDKLTAHSELRKVGDDYKLLDVGTLGLKWRDMNSTIQGIQHIVENINLLSAVPVLTLKAWKEVCAKQRQLSGSSLLLTQRSTRTRQKAARRLANSLDLVPNGFPTLIRRSPSWSGSEGRPQTTDSSGAASAIEAALGHAAPGRNAGIPRLSTEAG